MRHIDLFSGIGGFALASFWVWGEEYENVGHSEVEPYPCKVYHRHFPGSQCLGDITKIEWERFKGIDLLTGGFPCQPHSVAGKRKASADSRDLWGECARAVRVLRPRYALFENVPGLLVSERGRFFNRVLYDLAQIGYDAEWYTVGAFQIGAHHKRDRIWIVAYPCGARPGNISGEIGADSGRRTWGDESPLRQRDGKNGADRFDTTSATTGNDDSDTIRDATGSAHGEDSGEGIRGRNAEDSGERDEVRCEPANVGGSIRHHPITGLPDWSGGEMGQPWPVTEFEQPSGEDVGDTEGDGRGRVGNAENERTADRKINASDDSGESGHRTKRREVERVVCRVADGLPSPMDGTLPVTDRVARLKGLGNAIVPQVAAVILERINNAMERESNG